MQKVVSNTPFTYLGKVKKNWQLFPLIFFGESQKYERGGGFRPPPHWIGLMAGWNVCVFLWNKKLCLTKCWNCDWRNECLRSNLKFGGLEGKSKSQTCINIQPCWEFLQDTNWQKIWSFCKPLSALVALEWSYCFRKEVSIFLEIAINFLRILQYCRWQQCPSWICICFSFLFGGGF